MANRAGNPKTKHRTTITHTTTIGSVVGQVHTGSGNVEVGTFTAGVQISTTDAFVATLHKVRTELVAARQAGVATESVDAVAAEIAAAEQEARRRRPDASRIVDRLKKARTLVTAAAGVVSASAAAVAAAGKIVLLLEAAIRAVGNIF
jgi:hypothetical protein